MGVADDDGIGTRDVLLDRSKIRRNAAENALAQGSSRYVGIEQYDMIVATNLKTCRSKPANSNAGIEVGDECVRREFQVFWMHHDACSPFFPGCIVARTRVRECQCWSSRTKWTNCEVVRAQRRGQRMWSSC